MTKLTTIILGVSMCFWSSLATATVPNINFVSQSNISTEMYVKNSSQDTSDGNLLIIVQPAKEKPVDCKAPFRKLSAIQLLALTIYGESRNESVEGKIAVGTVIIERHIHRNQSIKNVILKHHQFSCFSLKDKQYDRLKNIAFNWKHSYRNSKSLRECYRLSKGLIDGTIVGNRLLMENEATYFKTPIAKWKPSMVPKLRFVCKIGGHQFYTETLARVEYVSFNTIFIKKNIILVMKDNIKSLIESYRV